MISDPRLNRIVPLGDILRGCFASVECDGFDAAFSSDRIQNIHTKLQEMVKPRSAPIIDRRRKEKIISEAWLAIDVDETLCPGYVFKTMSEVPSIASGGTERKVCGTVFISKLDQHLIQEGCSEFSLCDLSVVFKRGRTYNDPWNDCASAATEADNDDDPCNDGLGQFMSYAKRFFYFQHRTTLFMLFVNGGEFRVIRWVRSGCIVTEALNYVNTVEHTKKLLQFLYVYSKATREERGFDPTATRLSKDSCGWQWMQQIAAAHPKDLSHAEGTVLESVPEGFVIKPRRDAPNSPLFASNILAEDPTATTGFGDLSCVNTSSRVAPVFKYVRDFFRESIPETWMSYRLKVCGRDYLVGKPIFAPHDMVGRGTRGYVALEWKTQLFVFLKDVWRYRGLDQLEGTTLQTLNDGHVPFVPTLVCHEDVDGGRQETEVSEYSAPGSKTPDVFDEQEKESRPITPMPSRPGASRAQSATEADGPTSTASTSDDQFPIDATDSGRSAHGSGTGGRSRKRTRSQTEPVEFDDGTGLRPLTHYRIVVAQVCLPSSAFTNGMQLVRIVWNCIDGHGDAATRCNILHRDVSVGNILIYPIVKKANRATGQRILVLWGGLLSDWELAKKIPPMNEKPVARQPHLTGTWAYMSVNSVNYPGSPVSIPDELESFFHVLLYLAVRYLHSSLSEGSPRYFIEDYFNSSRTGEDDSALCSYTKEEVVRKGHLPLVGWKPITFFGDPEPSSPMTNPSASPSPLNDLIAQLLRHFKAHYAVMRYDAAIKARERQPKRFKPLPVYNSDAIAKTSTPAPPIASELYDVELLMGLWKKRYGDDQTPVMPRKVVERRPSADRTERTQGLQEPSTEEKRLAAALATHEHVNNLFFTYLTRPAVYVWPSRDLVGDQLKRRCVESSTAATSEEEEEEEEEEEDSDGSWYY